MINIIKVDNEEKIVNYIFDYEIERNDNSIIEKKGCIIKGRNYEEIINRLREIDPNCKRITLNNLSMNFVEKYEWIKD